MIGLDAIRWGNPQLWWVLLVPLALVPAWFAYERFRGRVERSLSGAGLLPSMVERASFGRRLATMACVLAGLELLGVGMMRPKYGLREVKVHGAGVDTVIVLDASRSMKAADVAPDRLTASTVEIARLLDGMRGNRVALVPFAGIAFIQSPLTVDHEVIKEYLRDLRVTDLPVPGTAIGRALKVAQQALGLTPGARKGSTQKAVILFTDGENFEGDPDKVAAELGPLGVRIYAVGVGTPAGQPIPVFDENGSPVGTAREKDGVTPLMSKLNEDLLKNLANKTGGRYVALSGASDVAATLDAELGALEKAEYQSEVEKALEDRFQYPVAAGLALLVLPFLWLGGGRGRRARTAATVALLLVAMASPARARDFFDRDHGGVTDALDLLAKGQAGDAAKALSDLAGELPGRPDLLYDVALAREKAGLIPEAIEAIDQATAALAGAHESRPDWPTAARLLHAKGTLLMRKARTETDAKKEPREVRLTWRQAVDALSQSLLADPNAEDSRRNLEMAAMAAYPPCSKLDDAYEPNNSTDEAKFLTPDPNSGEAKADLVLCPDDVDVFKLPLRPGETLFASVLEPAKDGAQAGGPPGGQAQGGEAPKPARVDVTLLDAAGAALKGPGKQEQHRARDEEAVYLKITGPKEEDGIPYTLDARAVPPCPQGDDSMEPNDSREGAKPLPDGDHGLRVCPGNEDWFAYTEKQGTRKQVVLQVPTGEGPLEMEAWSADGAPVDVKGSASAEGQAQVAMLPKAEQDAPFVIRVFGAGSQGFYQLSVKDADGGDKNQDGKDKDPKNQDQKDQEKKDQQKQKEQAQKPQQGSQTMRELLDAIDRNDENLEAKEAQRASPYREYVPEKDW